MPGGIQWYTLKIKLTFLVICSLACEIITVVECSWHLQQNTNKDTLHLSLKLSVTDIKIKTKYEKKVKQKKQTLPFKINLLKTNLFIIIFIFVTYRNIYYFESQLSWKCMN